jgi:hypothetical protein
MSNHFNDWERRRRRSNEEEGRYDRDFERGYRDDYEQERFGRRSGAYDRRYDYSQQGDYGQTYNRDYDEPVWTYSESWWVIGPATGRGPQGYQRSDERITEEVCERLTRHGQLDASEIEVQVKNGEVTLEGTVENRRAKRMAEDVAEGVSGVRDVHNRLRLGSLGWVEGMAEKRQTDTEGWVEGQGHQPQDSEGWVEGQGEQKTIGDPKGWAEGMAERR